MLTVGKAETATKNILKVGINKYFHIMNLNKISLLGFSTLLFISCSKQPSCMEEETLKTANDLARNIIMTDIAYEKYITDMRFDPPEQEI